MKLVTVVISKLFIILLLVSFSCGRNNSYCQTLTSVLQEIPQTGNLNSGNILSCVEEETIYFTPTYIQTSDRTIFAVGLDGSLKESVIIKQKGKKGLKNERIIQFEILENKLIILSNASIHFYRRSGNQFVLEKSIKNQYSFSGMNRLGRNLLLHVCYPFHPLDQEETNVWAKLDLSKQEITEIHSPVIDNTKFGCFVNSWVSTFGTTIAHASTSEYKIVFYNEFYKPVDSIVENEKYFGIDTIIVNKLKLQSKEAISNFMNLDEEKFTRIRKIFMLDDNHLLVLSKLSQSVSPPNGKARMDFWVKGLKGWEKKNQVFGDDIYRKGEVYDEQHPFLGNIYQNIYSICVEGGKLYSVSFPFYPKVVTQSFDMSKDIDSYFKDKSEFYYGLENFWIADN